MNITQKTVILPQKNTRTLIENIVLAVLLHFIIHKYLKYAKLG